MTQGVVTGGWSFVIAAYTLTFAGLLIYGISLAGWNLLASLIMIGCCLAAFLRLRKPLERAGLRRGTA